jgi:hypothetical protein
MSTIEFLTKAMLYGAKVQEQESDIKRARKLEKDVPGLDAQVLRNKYGDDLRGLK